MSDDGFGEWFIAQGGDLFPPDHIGNMTMDRDVVLLGRMMFCLLRELEDVGDVLRDIKEDLSLSREKDR